MTQQHMNLTMPQYLNLSLQIWGCLLSAIIIICMHLSKRRNNKAKWIYTKLLFFNAGVMFFDALALYFRGGASSIAYLGVRTANFLSFCAAAAVPTLFLHYLICDFKNPESITHKPLFVSHTVLSLQIVLYIVNLFMPVFYLIDEQNIYHRLPLYPCTFIPAFMNIAFSLYLLVRYRTQIGKAVRRISILYLLIPIPAFLIQMFAYGLNLVNFAGMIVMTLLFLFIQAEQAHETAEAEKRLLQQEIMLAESNNALVLSQIQPHFLYNALTAIYRLCDVSPEKAKNAIGDFSSYLRGNLDSIKQTGMISFSQELNHVQAYLSLEKMRYDDYLDIEYDIQASEFFVPPLSIQPLVENAVNHGVSNLPDGGRVTISTAEREGAYEIRISDNGNGFDENMIHEDGRSHIGIPNVRNRLRIMCSGTLNFVIESGRGTTAIIRIPMEK